MFTRRGSLGYFFYTTDHDQPHDPLTVKLRSFQRLPAGWSHGEGVPVSGNAIRTAEIFIGLARQLQLTADVFPGLNGECAVAFYAGDRTVEIVIDPARLDKKVGLHVEQGHGFDFKRILADETATAEMAAKAISSLVKDTWKSPASSPSFSLMETGAAFRMWFSSTSQEKPSILQTVN